MQFEGNKLYQRVAAAIAEAIEAGRWPEGSRLPGERDLAEEHKVSRPTIREAMIALEMRGWIEARHGSGLYVRPRPAAREPIARSLEFDVGAFELTEARILFEGEAVALAAITITDAQLAELEAILNEMDGNDLDRVFDADRRFHQLIAAATDNAAIRSVVDYLWDLRTRSPMCVAMFGRARRSGVTTRIEEHRPILEALRAHDPQAARAAMQAHLRGVIEDVLEATELEAMERARTEGDARRDRLKRRLDRGDS
ncbi:FadR/GntR family transcriptional regulator [Sphingomonas sp.]|uniref:FadR/GntR family transcriptional regulator n=1 Tax=Sphingomonas sp. TaxID=28214 RepID=UPI001B1A96CD|nr:FadR/GntR family transcriptional regulator [Sphingomonas sp.]MBO9711565.1 FadR family transcriptional regulator [Sphingomonas sp.]